METCEYQTDAGDCGAPAVGTLTARMQPLGWVPFQFCHAHRLQLPSDLTLLGFEVCVTAIPAPRVGS